MAAETIDPMAVAYLVEKFGFPVAVSIVLLCVITTLVVLMVKSIVTRQKLWDTYYFKNLDEKLDEYNTSLKDTSNTLNVIILEIRCMSLKLSECSNRIESLESKSIAYVFREGSINRVKNNQEIDVTTQIIGK
jgi:uncharacterized membrane protein YraQ (UPF0718 family)